jgi:hypothetical protein
MSQEQGGPVIPPLAGGSLSDAFNDCRATVEVIRTLLHTLEEQSMTHKFEVDGIKNTAQQTFEEAVICLLHSSKPVYQMYIFVCLISLSLMLIY